MNITQPQQQQSLLPDRHHHHHQNRHNADSSRRHKSMKNNTDDNGHRMTPISSSVSSPLPSSLSAHRLKTKIRDLTRLLRRPDHLPADVLVVQERALAGYKQALQGIEREKRKKEMIGKYHMVRFFERQKATRHLKQIRKRLATLPSDSASDLSKLQQELNTASIDLDYTIYYPLNQKYQSLYPPSSSSPSSSKLESRGTAAAAAAAKEKDEDEVVHAEEVEDKQENSNRPGKRNGSLQKPKMWDMVARCRETGQLDALRDGKLNVDAGKEKFESKAFGGKRKVLEKTGQQEEREMENDISREESDGGFFET